MTSQMWARVKEVFAAVVECDVNKRGKLLDQLCVGAPELRATVEDLLPHDGKISEPADQSTSRLPPSFVASPPGYEILEELGRGGMGVVFKARQVSADRIVAMKIFPAGQRNSPQARERFVREVKAIGSLNHPDIVRLYDAGEHDGTPYFSMEYCEGGSLAKKLKNGNAWSPCAAAELVEKLARVVHVAHLQKLIHRDLKPENVLLTAEGDYKIADFGLAKLLTATDEITRSGTVIGTPAYMAPEQAAGRIHDIGPATDVWALGVILYELLAGRRPFEGKSPDETIRRVLDDKIEPPSHVNPQVPLAAEAICLKCLQKDQAKRYQSARELADMLHRFQNGEPLAARSSVGHAVAFSWLLLITAVFLLVYFRKIPLPAEPKLEIERVSGIHIALFADLQQPQPQPYPKPYDGNMYYNFPVFLSGVSGEYKDYQGKYLVAWKDSNNWLTIEEKRRGKKAVDAFLVPSQSFVGLSKFQTVKTRVTEDGGVQIYAASTQNAVSDKEIEELKKHKPDDRVFVVTVWDLIVIYEK